MIRFLKYIFLIFGGIAALILTFFYIQNKEDLGIIMEYRSRLQYVNIKKNCDDKNNSYSCFEKEFDQMMGKVSLTGLSMGLKLAFNFLEESKENSYGVYKDIEFALLHLQVNNIAIKYGNNRFHGFEKTYGGYIGKLRDFLESSKEFSDNLIKGLKEGQEGFSSLKDEQIKREYMDRLALIEKDYTRYYSRLKDFVDEEIERLKKLYDVD